VKKYSTLTNAIGSRVLKLSLALAILLVSIVIYLNCINPIEKLSKTVPVKQTKELNYQLDRLVYQIETATVLERHASNLYNKYLTAVKRIKYDLHIKKETTTEEAYKKLLFLVGKAEATHAVTMTDRKNSYSQPILSLDFGSIIEAKGINQLNFNNLPIYVWQPLVGVGAEDDQSNIVRGPLELEAVRPFRLENGKPNNKIGNFVPTIFGVGTSSAFEKKVGTLFPYDNTKELNVKNKSKRQIFEQVINWVKIYSSIPPYVQTLKPHLMKVIEEAFRTMDNHLKEIHIQKLYFSSEKTALKEQLYDLQSRLRSSDSIFYVAALQTLLITFVAASIALILIRALAAELAQIRRINYLEISADLSENFCEGKPQYIADITRAVIGGKFSHKTETPSVVEDAKKTITKYVPPVQR